MSKPRFSVICISVLCFFAMLPLARAGGFLEAQEALLRVENVAQELEQALQDAMGHGHGFADEGKMEARRARILPMFESMPKNWRGAVNREAVQYMVHRYFGAVHGWSVQGFESKDLASARNTTTEGTGKAAKILREKLPSYVETVLESRLDHDGFTSQDVVVMVTVLERMIMDESVDMLEGAYHLNAVDTVAALDEERLQKVMESFMMIFALKAQRTNRTRHELVRNYMHKTRGPTGWPSGAYGAAETKIMMEQTRLQNPFLVHTYSFEHAMTAVSEATEGYGMWTNGEECHALKETLTSLDREGNGRVLIPDFYATKSVGRTWHFDESLEYLRAQGVLDESCPVRGPRVLISNYVQSLANCVDVSGFYSVCCLKECEAIMGDIEDAVREPSVTPGRLIPVVQKIIDAHEEEPRNLTVQLVSQLEAVAEQHQGKVPIHGRLFQQWLHYVFPYECPYPHKLDAVEAQVSKKWAAATGKSHRITKEEFAQYVELKNKLDEDAKAVAEAEEALGGESLSANRTVDMSHWTFEEELYVGYHHQGPRAERSSRSSFATFGSLMRAGVLLGGVATLGLMVAKSIATPTGGAKDKPRAHEVFV